MELEEQEELQELFDSGTDLLFEDNKSIGDVLYFNGDTCWVLNHDTNKEESLALDFYSKENFKEIE